MESRRVIHRYGDHPSQVGELFFPEEADAPPVCIVLHGGYWRERYDRSLMEELCLDLASHGWAAWNLEYRRVGGGGGWPETLADVAAGVDILPEVDAPLDLACVTAVGHSAGGHLALWAAARPTLAAGTPGSDPGVRIAAVVSQAGVADLRLAAELSPSAEPTRALLGDPEGDPDAYEHASPRARVPLRVPQLLLHGSRDDVVSPRIAESYAEAAVAAGDPCQLVVLPDTGHFEHIDASSSAWRTARDWLEDYRSTARS
jgi:acetyl esterase/lipase